MGVRRSYAAQLTLASLAALAALAPPAVAQGNCPELEYRPPRFDTIPCSTFAALGFCDSPILKNGNAPKPPGSYCASTCGRCPTLRITVIQITIIRFQCTLFGFTEASFTSAQRFNYRQTVAQNNGVAVEFVSITSVSVTTVSAFSEGSSRKLLQNNEEGLSVETSIDVPETEDTDPTQVKETVSEKPEQVFQGSEFEDQAEVESETVETEQREEEVSVAPDEDPTEALRRERTEEDTPSPGPAPAGNDSNGDEEATSEISELQEIGGNAFE